MQHVFLLIYVEIYWEYTDATIVIRPHEEMGVLLVLVILFDKTFDIRSI